MINYSVLSAYVTTNDLDESLNLYVSKTNLSEQLSGYVSNTNLSEQLSDYALKNTDSLNVVHDDRILKIARDPESNKFNVDIVTSSSTMNIMQIGLGKVDFGYNQIRTQHLMLADQSLQQIIRSDMSQRPKSTDVSLYTSLMIDNNFYNKSEIDTKISEVKTEIPEDVDLSNYFVESSGYLKFKQPLEFDVSGSSKEILKINALDNQLTGEPHELVLFISSDPGGDHLILQDKTTNQRYFDVNQDMIYVKRLNNGRVDYALTTDIPDSYTKSESDGKYVSNTNLSEQLLDYALKNELPTVPFNVVDNMIEPTNTLNFTYSNFWDSREYIRFNNILGLHQVQWIIKDNGLAGNESILEFACNDNGSVYTFMQFNDNKGVIIPNLYKNETVKYLTNEDLTTTLSDYVSNINLRSQLSDYVSNTDLSSQLGDYVLKSELPDTTTAYLEKNTLSWDITSSKEIFKLGSCGKEDGTWLFIEDNNYHGNGWYIISDLNRLRFKLNNISINPATVEFSENGISFKGDKLISESELQQSMTITHLAPIDEELDINSFVIGAPVYMTGKVYVKQNKRWYKSTVNDSIDCIPSVKTNGIWKEYLGICTHIDKESKEIKFATHGDYLVKVDDSSTYGIGDTVYIEHVIRDNISIPVLKILSEDIPLTTKINRMTVGIVTSIIDSKTISVIKD